MATAYFLVDSARTGPENMAIDQAMLRQTDRDGVVRIRFYRWSIPTLSLGYFQKYSEFEKFQQQLEEESSPLEVVEPLSVVRRATGGGAIVHHFDWTYSIAIPQGLETEKKSIGASCGLYFSLHQAVIQWINKTLDIRAGKAMIWSVAEGCKASESAKAVGCTQQSKQIHLAFLCFQRRSPGDIVVGNCKLMGSAQRRFQSAILQHGSLLLATSQYARELVGVGELLRQPAWITAKDEMRLREFADAITKQLAECYQWELIRADNDASFVEVDQDFRKRLESREWTARI